jgi:CheY-like chemotaxis protein
MGGEIGVVSAPGQGSTFWFTASLPEISPAKTAKDLDRKSSLAGGDQPGALTPLEPRAPPKMPGPILVVEDNLVNQKVIVTRLRKLGYQVDVVANGQEAVEASRRISYQLIFMDCRMPVMDGFEATRRIRQQERNQRSTPIVALTASAFEGERTLCLDAGMDDYLSKPFKIDDLHEKLERWLAVGAPDSADSILAKT